MNRYEKFISDMLSGRLMRLWLPIGAIAFGSIVLAFTDYPYPGQVVAMMCMAIIALYVYNLMPSK